ncbi:unnamed protein product, partial [Laminaria digitata]
MRNSALVDHNQRLAALLSLRISPLVLLRSHLHLPVGFQFDSTWCHTNARLLAATPHSCWSWDIYSSGCSGSAGGKRTRPCECDMPRLLFDGSSYPGSSSTVVDHSTVQSKA